MKKRIIIGLLLLAFLFFLGGSYIWLSMEEALNNLQDLAQIHHVDTLRHELLMSIERIQYGLKLKGTPYALDGQTVVTRGQEMLRNVDICLICHHREEVQKGLHTLKEKTRAYYRRAKAILNNPHESKDDQRQGAIRLGEELIRQTNLMINLTRLSIHGREQRTIKKVRERKQHLLLLLAFGPFLFLGIAYVLLTGLTKPIRKLLEATRRLKNGELQFRLEGLKDEFGEVANSFNAMALSLAQQMSEMARTEQLKVCGEMAASLAHEIRNPLAGMKVAIEVLMTELSLTEQDRAVFTKIIEQIRNIELLMRNLLDFARPAAAQRDFVKVGKILRNTVDFLKKHPVYTTGEAPKELIMEIDEEMPPVYADPQQLQQIFLNLLLNALEAVSQGGKIYVRASYDGKEDQLKIEIEDTGKGIPEELKEKIFEPFFTTKGKGTGLGLAVTKRLVEGQGGRITVERGVQGGALFRLTIPTYHTT